METMEKSKAIFPTFPQPLLLLLDKNEEGNQKPRKIIYTKDLTLTEYKIIVFPPQDWNDILLESAYLDPNPIDVDLQSILDSYYN